MARLKGAVSLNNLPANRGLIINLALFEVSHPEAPPPGGGNPTAQDAADLLKVVEEVHLERESKRPDFVKSFSLEHRSGYYFVQVRVILFRKHRAKILGQAEQFFFGNRPVRIAESLEDQVTFPISWPSTPIEDLGHIATFRPDPS